MICNLPIRYLDTWSGFEAAKTAPWPSRGLHHFGKFLEHSDEWAGRGCCCFLLQWHSLASSAHHEWAPESCSAQIWIFPTFDVSPIFFQRVGQPRPVTYSSFDRIICSIELSKFALQFENKFEDNLLNHK